jgi:hypothetical protein
MCKYMSALVNVNRPRHVAKYVKTALTVLEEWVLIVSEGNCGCKVVEVCVREDKAKKVRWVVGRNLLFVERKKKYPDVHVGTHA